MINGVQGFSNYGYSAYPTPNYELAGTGFSGNPSEKAGAVSGIGPNKEQGAELPGLRSDKTEASQECQTCKSRKYQDGSNENVSFKAPTHVSPNAAAGAVRAHEGEHVSNAYTKAAQDNGKVVRASVSIHTSVCPECGRTYVSGGVTNTAIKYENEENPYVKSRKAQQAEALKGQFVDYAA